MNLLDRLVRHIIGVSVTFAVGMNGGFSGFASSNLEMVPDADGFPRTKVYNGATTLMAPYTRSPMIGGYEFAFICGGKLVFDNYPPYAAGNLTDPGMQVLHAAAHGTRVGATVAFSLADEDLRDGRRASGARADWEHRYAGEDPVWSSNPNGSLVAEVGSLPAGRALDIGSGEGADAIWLAERGWRAEPIAGEPGEVRLLLQPW